MDTQVSGQSGITSSLEEIAYQFLYMVVEIFVGMVDLLVSALVDALIWLFHSALMKPLVSEFIGDFMINDNMLSLKETEMMGLLLNYCYQKMQLIAILVIMLIASWQLFKTFFAYFGQTATEEGWKIGLKVIVYGLLIFKAKDICLIAIRMFNEVAQEIGGIALTIEEAKVIGENEIAKSVTRNGMKDAILSIYNILENTEFSKLETYGELAKFCIIIAIDFKLLKMAIDMAEKYMNVMLMIVISPIAFACGVAKSTNRFFSKWVNFFISGILYQLLQYTVICMLHSITKGVVRQSNATRFFWGGQKNVLVEGVSAFRLLFVVWGILSIGENAVSIIDDLGFSSLGQSANQLYRFVQFIPANQLYNKLGNLKNRKKKKGDKDENNLDEGSVGANYEVGGGHQNEASAHLTVTDLTTGETSGSMRINR